MLPMHCFEENINNRIYFLHFILLLWPPKSPSLPNLGGHPYTYGTLVLYTRLTRTTCSNRVVHVYIHQTYILVQAHVCIVDVLVCMYVVLVLNKNVNTNT